MPPLRRPRDSSPSLQPSGATTSYSAASKVVSPIPEVTTGLKPIKPSFVRHAPERAPEDVEDSQVAAAPSLVPRLTRSEYYSSPSVEAMSRMSEAKLSRIDNLEIGRYGHGSIRWPGLTDVRRLDFDTDVSIEKGSLTLYPDREKPPVGEGLNKEAVVTLNVRPSRTDVKLKSADMLRARLEKISEEFGGKFISYDMEKWIFRVPNFSGSS